VVELARERELDVGLREQAGLFCRRRRSASLLPLQLQDVLDILRPSLPAWIRTAPSLRSAALSATDWPGTEIDSVARATVLGSMA